MTACGMVFGLLALEAFVGRNWQRGMLLLFAALVLDALDGPLARRLRISSVLPHFDGTLLDLLVDYVNFVVVPALYLLWSDALPPGFRFFAAAAVTMSALYHYCNKEIKTVDHYFVGFPAFWNLVVMYLYLWQPDPFAAAIAVIALCVLTLTPVKCVHPFRVRDFQPGNQIVAVLSIPLGGYLLAQGAPLSVPQSIAAAVPLLYFTYVSLARTAAGVATPSLATSPTIGEHGDANNPHR